MNSTDNPNALVFDWHEENKREHRWGDFSKAPEGRETSASFLSWLLPHVLVDLEKRHGGDWASAEEQIMAATDKLTNCVLTMQINGIEVNVDHFLASFMRNLDYQAERAAVELVQRSCFGDEITEIMSTLRRELLQRLGDLGIEIREDDW